MRTLNRNRMGHLGDIAFMQGMVMVEDLDNDKDVDAHLGEIAFMQGMVNGGDSMNRRILKRTSHLGDIAFMQGILNGDNGVNRIILKMNTLMLTLVIWPLCKVWQLLGRGRGRELSSLDLLLVQCSNTHVFASCVFSCM